VSATVAFFRLLVSIYFREIEVVGEIPSAAIGGRLFAANHFNGLIDPILVLTSARCPVAPVAKATLWKIPLLASLLDAVGAVPVQRRKDAPDKAADANEEVFARVAAHLRRGGNILIFPEGISHDEPHVVRLRSGAGRMLARARAEGALGRTYQAVGLEFDARDVFRSRALVVYGPVRRVDDHEGSSEEIAAAITARLAEDLSELVVEGETWDERLLVARVAELFANRAGERSMAALNAIGRQVEAAREALGPAQSPEYAAIADAVGRYYDALADAGLQDHDVETADAPRRTRKRARVALAILLPLALAGAVLWWLPYQLPRLLAGRLARSKNGSDRDVVSTYKLVTGVVAFPVWAGALVVTALAVAPWPWAMIAAAIALASPFAALAWLDWLERPRRVGRAAVGAPGQRKLTALRAARGAAMGLLEEQEARETGGAGAPPGNETAR
jgi:1-acyl-sn-glycerol-3-phosphate acyltransferase